MTNQQLILKKKLVLQLKKEKELREWLLKNFNSPDRIKIINDLNALSVDLETTKVKLINIKRNAPLLGLEMPVSTRESENKPYNNYK